MTVLPLALKLDGRRVLVIGAGRVGNDKVARLLEAGARVSVISREVLVELPEAVDHVEERDYQTGDLAGFALVVSATGDPTTNDRIVAEAHDRGVWINVVDDPGRSDFYFTAVHRSGDVTVSVSTGGASPALAQSVRNLIRRVLPDDLANVARVLREERDALHARGATTEGRDWRPRIEQLLDLERD